MRKATKKASAAAETPNAWAMTMSRRNPRTRLTPVREPMIPAVALASPGHTVDGLLRALQASEAEWGPRTAVNLPALATTVGEIAAALARLAGPAATGLLDWQADARIAAVVGGWPSRFNAARARGLGLLPDASVDALLQAYVQDHPEAVSLPLLASVVETRA